MLTIIILCIILIIIYYTTQNNISKFDINKDDKYNIKMVHQY